MFRFTGQFYKAIKTGLTEKCTYIINQYENSLLNYHCDAGMGFLKDSKTHVIFLLMSMNKRKEQLWLSSQQVEESAIQHLF